MRFLPTVSPTSGPRLVRHLGTAAPLSLRAVADHVREPVHDIETYRDATILLAATALDSESFTGAEGGLPAPGVRVVIAPGFGPAFFSEAIRRGILLVALPQAVIDGMSAWIAANPRQEMTVDLEAQLIDMPGMGRIPFETPPRVRHRLLYGLNDLDELIQHREDAIAFRMDDRKRRPWLYATGAPIEPSGGGSGETE